MTEKDDRLIDTITQALDKQTGELDAEILQRIGGARRRALAQLKEPAHISHRWSWIAGGAVVFACSALIVSAVLFRPETPLNFSPQELEFELMASLYLQPRPGKICLSNSRKLCNHLKINGVHCRKNDVKKWRVVLSVGQAYPSSNGSRRASGLNVGINYPKKIGNV